MQIAMFGRKLTGLMVWRRLIQEPLSKERLLFVVIGTVPLVMQIMKMMAESSTIILIFLRIMATALLHLMRVRLFLIK